MNKRAFLFLIFVYCAPAAKAAERLRLYLDWTPNVEFAGIYAAIEKGWYAQAGIDLRIVFHGLDVIPNVLRGDADLGMTSGHTLIHAAAAGKNLKAVAAQFQLNPDSVVVARDSSIAKLEDLRGKTIGLFSDAPTELGMYRILLGSVGIPMAAVHFHKLKSFKEKDLIAALRSHTVDAFIVWEFARTVSFALLDYPVRVFPGYEHGFHYYGMVYFAPDRYLNKHRALIQRFLKVTFDGWREVYKQPEHYAELVVSKYYPKKNYLAGSRELTLKQQTLELKLRQRYFYEGVGRERIGSMTEQQWKKSIDIARRYGLIPELSPLTPADVVDTSLMRELVGGTP